MVNIGRAFHIKNAVIQCVSTCIVLHLRVLTVIESPQSSWYLQGAKVQECGSYIGGI